MGEAIMPECAENIRWMRLKNEVGNEEVKIQVKKEKEMAFKKTGLMYKPTEISIMICDICGNEIGLPDGYHARP
jgi:hypothetical protein